MTLDLTTDFTEVSGRLALAQSLVRRWSTDRGELIDDPTGGTNLTDHINDDMSEADVANALSAAEDEARKDERVKSISSSYALLPDDSGDGEILIIDFVVEDADGPFTLTLSIDSVTVTLLTVTT